MMKQEEYIPLGYITKTRGLKGEVQLFFQVEDPEQYKNLESVFLEINKKLVPFFISKISIQKNVAYLFFEDINHIDQATSLIKKSVFITKKQKPAASKKFKHESLIGYYVEDERDGRLGSIEKTLQMPQQILISMRYKEKEVLFPFVEGIVKRIDKKNKILEVNLPEGLLAIYIEE